MSETQNTKTSYLPEIFGGSAVAAGTFLFAKELCLSSQFKKLGINSAEELTNKLNELNATIKRDIFPGSVPNDVLKEMLSERQIAIDEKKNLVASCRLSGQSTLIIVGSVLVAGVLSGVLIHAYRKSHSDNPDTAIEAQDSNYQSRLDAVEKTNHK
jgi:hypothetical protein